MNASLFLSLNSWKDFEKYLLSLNKKEKGNAFEQLTKFYFQLDPVHRTYYDDIWLFSEVPQKHLEKLGLPAQDLGIDLIARVGEEYHAIQCKYHTDNATSVTFKEVATFLSLFESNNKITKGYICSSADLTSKNLDKVRSEHITLVLSDTWNALSSEFFDAIRAELQQKKVELVPFLPKPHQVKAIDEAKKYFLEENQVRGKLIFPCGAGKSLTGFWLTRELGAKSVVVAVPSLSLVKQTLDVYLREIVAHKKKVKWLCICSDEGIGKGDDIAIRTENIGVPCVTDPEYIAQWLKANRDEEKIIFTTYQSGRILAEVSKLLKYTFDLGIFDEAHKTVGADKKLFSHLLFEENIAIRKRIFMTATERFYAGSKDDIISMDNEEIYGDAFTQMSFKEAIETGLLTDYKVITIDIQKSEIADFIRDNKLVELNGKWKKDTEARSLASMLALRKAMKLFPIRNAVSFHSSIDKAQRNKELQQFITDSYQYEPIDTYTVSGQMPTTKRNEIVREFASSSRSLITNARCLTEGVDVPNIDCIVFSDPRKSKVDIVQALGRALRKKEGKDWGYVILPVIYDDATHEIDNENFQEILAIVRGLASNDERIVEYFREKNDTERNTQSNREKQFQFEVFSEFIDAGELSSQLQVKLWEKLSRFSWMPFEEAREYVRSKKLKSQIEWSLFIKSIDFPKNIPKSPYFLYKNNGWVNWGDWLGTDRLANYNIIWLPFESAREFVHGLGLKNYEEWKLFCNSDSMPKNIPRAPDRSYKSKGWIGYGDWLGTGRVANFNIVFKSFNEAKKFVHGLKISSSIEWKEYCKSGNKPEDIPSVPNGTYKNDGWTNWGDWLGTGSIADKEKEFLRFEEARELVRKLNLKSSTEWQNYAQSNEKPSNIPSAPHHKYKNDGWVGYGDWLGTGRINYNSHKYRDFESDRSFARSFARSLKLNNKKEWINFCRSSKKPNDIPSKPEIKYANQGWKGMGDWLGYLSHIDKEFLSFEDAKNKMVELGIKSMNEWRAYYKLNKPKNLPAAPNVIYKNTGWKGFGDFFGTGTVAYYNKEFRDFIKAREFARQLNLKSVAEWREYCKAGKLPSDISSSPHNTYKNKGWINYGDWLGNGRIADGQQNWVPIEQAKIYVKENNIKSKGEWVKFKKLNQIPKNIPLDPFGVYTRTNEWISWTDFFGHNIPYRPASSPREDYMSFEEAKKWIKENGIQTSREYTSYKRPNNLPRSPHTVVQWKDHWKGWADFLGKDN